MRHERGDLNHRRVEEDASAQQPPLAVGVALDARPGAPDRHLPGRRRLRGEHRRSGEEGSRNVEHNIERLLEHPREHKDGGRRRYGFGDHDGEDGVRDRRRRGHDDQHQACGGGGQRCDDPAGDGGSRWDRRLRRGRRRRRCERRRRDRRSDRQLREIDRRRCVADSIQTCHRPRVRAMPAARQN